MKIKPLFARNSMADMADDYSPEPIIATHTLKEADTKKRVFNQKRNLHHKKHSMRLLEQSNVYG